jgi:hypothetical protein
MHMNGFSHYRQITQRHLGKFLSLGYKARHVFPHSIYYLPKCGPDGFKLARSMCGAGDVNQLWEIVLYAARRLVDQFPADLFFDDDLIWHQQQFGRPGQIATANVVLDGDRLYSMVHISDLVQRISRRREHKTRIENRFKGWNHMLLNAILNFARERGVALVHVPTSDWALRHTDPKRNPGHGLFNRIYDATVQQLFAVERNGPWWVIDTQTNGGRAVAPEARKRPLRAEKVICLCHDVERGHGHEQSDPSFAAFSERMAPRNLEEILAREREAGIKATYNVVGRILPEIREAIERDGHCLAFHSFNHRIAGIADSGNPGDADDLETGRQLRRCRQLDYRIKGYRPPQSRITPELTDENLCWYNFEWLASSAYSLGRTDPWLENRIVKIPLLFDEFPMYRDGQPYEDWEAAALQAIEEHPFAAFSLHDCYAHLWLPHYASFLDKMRSLGTLKTLNQVADAMFLANSEPAPTTAA